LNTLVQAQQNVNEASFLLQNNVNVALERGAEINAFIKSIDFFSMRGEIDRALIESRNYKSAVHKWLGLQ